MENRGIIFDFDGVIIDSVLVQKEAFHTCYKAHFGKMEDSVFDEFLSYGGDSLENIFELMNIPVGLLEKYREISASQIDKIKVFPGVEDLLKVLKRDENLKICLFTGKESKRTYDILEHFHLKEYFHEIICSDQIKNPKPNEEGILLFSGKTGIKKESIIMIGDAPNDILCAKNAGIISIAALWGNPELDVHKLHPDYIVRSAEELLHVLCDRILENNIKDIKRKGTIAVINGPNMNYLGKRDRNFYGTSTMKEIEKNVREASKNTGYDVIFFQSNSESEIVDFIQDTHELISAVIINPAAFTISGYSILEAINLFELPFIEVHMSNIFAREEWHRESIFSPYAAGTITGLKGLVYMLAFQALLKRDAQL